MPASWQAAVQFSPDSAVILKMMWCYFNHPSSVIALFWTWLLWIQRLHQTPVHHRASHTHICVTYLHCHMILGGKKTQSQLISCPYVIIVHKWYLCLPQILNKVGLEATESKWKVLYRIISELVIKYHQISVSYEVELYSIVLEAWGFPPLVRIHFYKKAKFYKLENAPSVGCMVCICILEYDWVFHFMM